MWRDDLKKNRPTAAVRGMSSSNGLPAFACFFGTENFVCIENVDDSNVSPPSKITRVFGVLANSSSSFLL